MVLSKGMAKVPRAMATPGTLKKNSFPLAAQTYRPSTALPATYPIWWTLRTGTLPPLPATIFLDRWALSPPKQEQLSGKLSALRPLGKLLASPRWVKVATTVPALCTPRLLEAPH